MNFKILSKFKKTSEYINKLIISFPNKEYILKNNLDECLYKGIELLYYYELNINKKIKEKYLFDFLVNLSMINYYVLICYERKYISNNKFNSISNFLLEIKKMSYGLIEYVRKV